jgi:hypothetical protein
VRGKLGVYINYMICQCQLVVELGIRTFLRYGALTGVFEIVVGENEESVQLSF